jgi:hypothetical protein
MKSAFLATINPGYMFSLNATMNAMKYYGTEADFHILYHAAMPKEYMEACSKAFPFDVVWHPIVDRNNRKYGDLYHAYFADKYWLANHLKDDYDAVCIIDGDLFLCANMNEFFEQAYQEKKLLTATHEHSSFPIESLYNHPVEGIKDRMYAALADFPVFFDPAYFNEFIKDWYEFTFEEPQNDERSHPLIAFNRSVRKNLSLEEIIVLDGHTWVCDKNYWEEEYRVIDWEDKKIMVSTHKSDVDHDDNVVVGSRVFSIHNRWWKDGRANGELRNDDGTDGFIKARNNFNVIKDFMVEFNKMTPETYWDDYVKEKF